ncbi:MULTISPECIES: PBSX family phage terminase large subunit [unclassified Streptomyces]|uniref:PBSX family phage terminase large subunit n=1 Tax=unclassified Streptomyces TaxID=2593676 RepID=UPI002E1753BE|nr:MULTISPECIES: PBSX family phage terminase large subunit [unclassified Streptomyces]
MSLLDALPLSRKQLFSVVEADGRINAWEGSVRSGKTIASLLRWLIFVASAPTGGELVMVGRTRDSLFRNVIAPLTNPEIVGALTKQVKYNQGAPVAIIMGRVVHVLGANDAKAEPKVRGMTCAGAYVDEATTLPKTFFDQLVARCSVKGARIFTTTNPDNPAHWFRKEYLKRPAETGLRSWHFTLDDNPYLDPEYVRFLKSTYTGLFYRRNILGHWVQAEGAIYEAFDPQRHVVTELPRIDRWLCDAIDYGTTNPYADLLIGLGSDQRLYVTSEYRWDSRAERRKKTDTEYSEARRRWLASVPQPTTNVIGVQPEWTIVDPSAASYIEQLHRDGVSGVTAADNAVVDGIRTVSSLFAGDRLRIHPSAAGLIEEIPGYSWDDEAAGKGEDKPIKQDDHSCDALRYGLRTTEALWRPYLPTRLEVAA